MEDGPSLYPELDDDPDQIEVILWHGFFDEMKKIGLMPKRMTVAEYLEHPMQRMRLNKKLKLVRTKLPSAQILEKVDALMRRRSTN